MVLRTTARNSPSAKAPVPLQVVPHLPLEIAVTLAPMVVQARPSPPAVQVQPVRPVRVQAPLQQPPLPQVALVKETPEMPQVPVVPVVLDLLQRLLPLLLPAQLPPLPAMQVATLVETLEAMLVVTPEPTQVVQAVPGEAEVVAEADTTVKDSPHETLSHKKSAGRPQKRRTAVTAAQHDETTLSRDIGR